MRMFSEGQTQRNIRSFCEDVRELTQDFRLFQADYSPELYLGKYITGSDNLATRFCGYLSEIGFIQIDAAPSTPALNTSSENYNLIKQSYSADSGLTLLGSTFLRGASNLTKYRQAQCNVTTLQRISKSTTYKKAECSFIPEVYSSIRRTGNLRFSYTSSSK